MSLVPELNQGPPEALQRGAGDQRSDPGSVLHPVGHGSGQLGGRGHLEPHAHRGELLVPVPRR